ncbi:AAA family ATPase [Zavarzinia compransoris]|uniref:Recombinase RecF n=1 Tax=Zavarzinia compransoris TaxID=1264899 RepID=A0A317DYK2_9PROT|nr:AAA family ATPase [Zavarzinia compransoris]PWR19827.1 recombinase RecF [Zavarzinia compransoris]TDP45066.1 putative ATPase [Zavarzinia compransoris]
MIRHLRIRNYRSLRNVAIEPAGLTVVTGGNGAGKSNLYRALTLLGAAARGTLAPGMVEEGGMPSALWAGEWRKDERSRIIVEVESTTWSYSLALGLPPPPEGAFALDPRVKEEYLHDAAGNSLMERKGPSAWMRVRGARGRTAYPFALDPQEAALAQLREPHLYPEVAAAQGEMARWRFYHHFRTDAASPIRNPQVGTRTTVLAADGHDLAAAVATLREGGPSAALDRAVDRAFPGARLEVEHDRGEFTLLLKRHDIERPFAARELSDGTLRFLCLATALLSARPSPLLILNEPDQSLHPDLAAPLAELILDAAARSQVWVITHSEALARHLVRGGAAGYDLRLEGGATVAEAVT